MHRKDEGAKKFNICAFAPLRFIYYPPPIRFMKKNCGIRCNIRLMLSSCIDSNKRFCLQRFSEIEIAKHVNPKLNAANPNAMLFRVGGISAILLFVSYVSIIVVYVVIGAGPAGVEESLNYLAAHTMAWWIILGLSVFTDILFIPISFALYDEFKDANKNAIVAGIVFLMLFVILDLALTWPAYAALINLGGKYAALTADAERASVVAAASYAYSFVNSGLLGIYIILIPAFGFLVFGLVMINSRFNKITAYLGVVAGILGIASVLGGYISSDFGHVSVIITSTLITIWTLLVGLRLFRFSQAES